MRAPERIDPLISALTHLWKRYPDMRFGQLVSNIHRVPGSIDYPPGPDLFNVEDDELLRRLTLAAERWR